MLLELFEMLSCSIVLEDISQLCVCQLTFQVMWTGWLNTGIKESKFRLCVMGCVLCLHIVNMYVYLCVCVCVCVCVNRYTSMNIYICVCVCVCVCVNRHWCDCVCVCVCVWCGTAMAWWSEQRRGMQVSRLLVQPDPVEPWRIVQHCLTPSQSPAVGYCGLRN